MLTTKPGHRKPKNARAKRAMEKRAPQMHENTKTVLFVTGNKSSQILKLAVSDLTSLKRPFCERFNKKNDIHPFEDASSLEFFSSKNDTSLIVLSIHSKKRPHCLTFIRTFDYKVLDMLELYINPETFRQLQQFKNKKPGTGLKPLIAFHGTVFESPTQTKYTLAKSLLLDFFRGQETTEVDVTGLQYQISISAEEEEEGQPAPKIHLRFYLIRTMRSGQKLPRVELEEMGPRFDFTVGREKFADPDMLKEAMKKPKGAEPKTKKNIDMDIMGDKVGKVHVGKQDFSTLQTRKMKGLKRGRDEDKEEGEDDGDTMVDGEAAEEDDSDDGGVELPAPKKGKF
ncbi:Brix-domain-containing protein [Westerdykella ornata]|uniref:Ribosome production factor 2 homolog n=1 Tax=Westerdykella ornata TaxID=318751 RepID=A0A6A6JMS4_WESOR|nr:Brix-domain-containing protein [Westerdykella ornata]KAF2277534.1 Brix-domain-containing protein [Westerdykella ornata]